MPPITMTADTAARLMEKRVLRERARIAKRLLACEDLAAVRVLAVELLEAAPVARVAGTDVQLGAFGTFPPADPPAFVGEPEVVRELQVPDGFTPEITLRRHRLQVPEGFIKPPTRFSKEEAALVDDDVLPPAGVRSDEEDIGRMFGR
jgi:hypothetical protein